MEFEAQFKLQQGAIRIMHAIFCLRATKLTVAYAAPSTIRAVMALLLAAKELLRAP